MAKISIESLVTLNVILFDYILITFSGVLQQLKFIYISSLNISIILPHFDSFYSSQYCSCNVNFCSPWQIPLIIIRFVFSSRLMWILLVLFYSYFYTCFYVFDYILFNLQKESSQRFSHNCKPRFLQTRKRLIFGIKEEF